MSVAIIVNSQRLRNIYQENIEVYLDLKTNLYNSCYDFLKTYSPTTIVDAIITESYVADKKCLERLISETDLLSRGIPIFCLDKPPGNELMERVFFLNNESDLVTVIRGIAKIKGITAHYMANLEVPEFYGFGLNGLKYLKTAPTEIFFRKDLDIVSIIKQGAEIPFDTLQHLVPDETFYVKSLDRLKLINSVTDAVISTLTAENSTPKQTLSAVEGGVELIQSMANELGIDKAVVKVADASIKAVQKLFSKNKKISAVVNSLMNEETSVRMRLLMITCYIGSKIIDEAEWGSAELMHKLCFMCIFCDITLSKDEYVLIRSDEELTKSNFDPLIKEKIRNHALDAAKIVSTIKGAPIGMDSMIKYHHGNKFGMGFEKNFLNISPIGLIYMIASDFAFEYVINYNKSDSFDKKSFLAKIRKTYESNPKFKSYFHYFESIRL